MNENIDLLKARIKDLISFYRNCLESPTKCTTANDLWRCNYAIKQLTNMQKMVEDDLSHHKVDIMSSFVALNRGVEQFDDQETNAEHVKLNDQMYYMLTSD